MEKSVSGNWNLEKKPVVRKMIGHSGKVICFALLNKYYVLTKQFPRYLCLLLWVITAVSVSLEIFLFDFLSSLVFCN